MVSRADRLSKALGEMSWRTIEEAQLEVETLRDELQNWLDNMPENLQNSTKADQLQEAIDKLEDINNELTTIIESIQEQADETVEFPSMY